MKITVIGSGYVGTTTAVVLASLNHQVVGADIDTSKIEKLREGILPFVEPGLDTLLKDMIHAGHLKFTSNIQEAVQVSDVLFISVGTPPREDGTADLQFLRSVADSIAESINGYKVIVTKSTVPIGTNRWLFEYLSQKIGDTRKFDVISNPEFLREGAALYDTRNPERTVIGGTSRNAIGIMRKIYKQLRSNFIIADWETAELIKYASNSFLATKISFINEIARIADRTGADIKKVAMGMGMDTRIGSEFLQAGIGYGGSCFPKDVKALLATARSLGADLKILEAVELVNKTQTDWYLEKLTRILHDTTHKPWTIAILGLTFKRDTDDQRESPAIRMIHQILKDCKEIRIFDPTVTALEQTPWSTEMKIKVCSTFEETFALVDAAILCTDWEIFATIDWKETARNMHIPILIDGRNMYDPDAIRALGIQYVALGRGNAS